MRSATLLFLVSALGANASPQGAGPAAGCQALPKEVKMGPGVEMKPQDIPSGCSDFEVLVARGTSEPNFAQGGKFGVVVGDPVIGNLTKVFPTARGYPVQYPADSNVVPGIRAGVNDVIKRLTTQDTACPNQKFALIGYSQGAALMHNAAPKIPAAIQQKVVALVMFGDPELRNGPKGMKFPPVLEGRLLENCAEGDMVCDKGSCFFPHLNYIRQPWVDKTVNFLVAAFKGTPMPAKTSGIGLENTI